jgi:hypothetical protein
MSSATLLAVSLVVVSTLIAQAPEALTRSASYVQIISVTRSPDPLQLKDTARACGTATVHLYAYRGGNPDPTVSVFLGQSSSLPPDVRVSVTPEQQSLTFGSAATMAELTFRVCATGSLAGTATVQAVLGTVKAGRPFEIHKPDPEETGRISFTITQ